MFLLLIIFFYSLVYVRELSNLREDKLELEMRNENLRESVDYLRQSLNDLERKYRRLSVLHSKCRAKIIYLHR